MSETSATTQDVEVAAALLDEAMRNALIGQSGPVHEAAMAVKEIDARRRHSRMLPTGLADNLLALAAATTPSRATRLEWQAEALDMGADPYLRDTVKRDLDADPITEFQRLGWHDEWNRVVTLVNSIIRNSLSAVGGSPQGLVQIPVDLVFTIPKFFELTERQKKQLLLAQRVGSDPQLRAAASPALFQKAEAYKKRLDNERRDSDLALARRLYEKDRLREASDLCKGVLAEKRDDSKARALLLKSDTKDAAQRRNQAAAFSILGNEPWPAMDAAAARLYASMIEQTARFGGPRPPGVLTSPPASLAPLGLDGERKYLASAESDARGERGKALDELRTLAKGDGAMAARAKAWTGDARYNPQLALDNARAQLAADRRKFIFLGASPDTENLYLASSAAATESASAAIGVVTMNFLSVFTRSISMIFKPTVSTAPVMDAMATSLREPPNSSGAVATRLQYAELCRYMEQEPLAIRQYELAGKLTDDLRRSLREREAKRAYRSIRDLPKPAGRAPEYDKWLKRWGDLKMAEDVREARDKDAEEIRPAFRLTRDILRGERDKWLALGLPIDKQLIDGKGRGGVIDKKGVALVRQDAQNCAMEYRLEGDARLTTAPVAKARYDVLHSAWEEREYHERRLEIASEARQTYYFPMDVEGGAGTSGVHAYPQFQQAPDAPDLALYKD